MTEPGELSPSHPIPVAATPPTEPAMPPTCRDPLALVERIATVNVQPGDILVFEIPGDPVSDSELDAMSSYVREALGTNTVSLVVNGKLSNVLRPEKIDLEAVVTAARRAAHAWGCTDSEGLSHVVAAAVRAALTPPGSGS